MYSTYDSKYDKDISIYRGISFDKENSNELKIFNNIKKNLFRAYEMKEHFIIDYAPSSFSRSLNIAEWFAKRREANYLSIMYYIHMRYHNEIDVCSDELAKKIIYKHEKELLLATNIMEFNILQIINKGDILEVILKEAFDGN